MNREYWPYKEFNGKEVKIKILSKGMSVFLWLRKTFRNSVGIHRWQI